MLENCTAHRMYKKHNVKLNYDFLMQETSANLTCSLQGKHKVKRVK